MRVPAEKVRPAAGVVPLASIISRLSVHVGYPSHVWACTLRIRRMLCGLRCIATHHLSRKCDYVTFALGHKRVKRLTLRGTGS